MVAHLLFRLAKYETAERYFLYSSNQPGLSPKLKAAYMGYSAICLAMVNKHMESYVRFLEINFELQRKLRVGNVLEAIEMIFSPTTISTKNDILIALSGTINAKFGREILEYHQGNKSIHSTSGVTLTKVQRILEYYFTMINDGVHRAVADFTVGVGVKSELFGHYHQASRLYRKAE